MKSLILILVFSVVSCNGVTPVQKCIELLKGMHAKGDQEKRDEQVRFSKFDQWCTDTTRNRENAVNDGNRKINLLQANIQKAETDAARLAEEITDLQNTVGKCEKEKKDAQVVRAKERADYLGMHADFSESVDAIGRAISVLKKQNFDRKQVLLQVRALSHLSVLSNAERAVLTNFLSDPDEDFMSRSSPDANAYEFQSGGVIDMLEKLKNKFEVQRRDLEKEEMNEKHSFETLAQDLNDQVENANASIARKDSSRNGRLEDGGSAKADLTTTIRVRDEDAKYLQDTKQECEVKSRDFAARQKLRGEELDAISQAVDILSSSVTGSAEKHLPTMFVQFRSTVISEQINNVLQERVAAFLRSRAEMSNSHMLSMIADKVEEDPFTKVKKMIQTLVYRLMEEAGKEAEEKGWCDAELAKNTGTRDQKSSERDALRSEVEVLQAKIAKLQEEISNLTDEQQKLSESVSQATALRNEEKTKNTETVKNAKDSQEAVAQALQILKEFYAKATSAVALTQNVGDDAPTTFDKPYHGMQSESGGIIGILEVILSDFARLESETSGEESTSASEFKTFINDSQVDAAVKKTQMEQTISHKSRAQQSLQSEKRDLESTVEELDAANKYYDTLHARCVSPGVSYEERVERRKDEIQSLKEALKILAPGE